MSGESEQKVNQVLTEMDGLEARRNVFVVAATKRPELIGPAMLRPGRLDRLLYVPLPSPADRVILRALSATVSLEPDVDMETVGRSRKIRRRVSAEPIWRRYCERRGWMCCDDSRTTRPWKVGGVPLGGGACLFILLVITFTRLGINRFWIPICAYPTCY
ncbi:unnamed protein product [Ascophyllum nodosum]